jgi:hypothetical protein
VERLLLALRQPYNCYKYLTACAHKATLFMIFVYFQSLSAACVSACIFGASFSGFFFRPPPQPHLMASRITSTIEQHASNLFGGVCMSMIGKTLEHYKIGNQPLGKGGMGEVYRASNGCNGERSMTMPGMNPCSRISAWMRVRRIEWKNLRPIGRIICMLGSSFPSI